MEACKCALGKDPLQGFKIQHVNPRCPQHGIQDRGHGYEEFRRSLAEIISSLKAPLYTTDLTPSQIKAAFLDNLPYDLEVYDCHACLSFLSRYGGLVAIGDNGVQWPALWGSVTILPYFENARLALWNLAERARVTGVFVSSQSVWGTPETPPWTHLYGVPPSSLVWPTNGAQTARQKAREYRENCRMLPEALYEYRSVLSDAERVLRSESLARHDKFIEQVRWLIALRESLDEGLTARLKTNLLYRAAATAPAGWCHVKSSMIGSLLDDLKAGLSFDMVRRRFNEKMHPLKYQRPQLVKEGNIDQAETLINRLGLRDSLKRRFAHLEDIDCFWYPQVTYGPAPGGSRVIVAQDTPGVFDHIRPVKRPQKGVVLPVQTMTWVKFLNTVLPIAHRLELLLSLGRLPLCAMTAPVYPEAPPLLRWDSGIAWYLYHGGSTPQDWNLAPGYVEVTGLAGHPDLGAREKLVFFLLKWARDLRYTAGGTFFPEFLRGDLYAVRSTLEAYAKRDVLQGKEQATACGYLLGPQNTQKITLLVNDQDHYLIDRWD